MSSRINLVKEISLMLPQILFLTLEQHCLGIINCIKALLSLAKVVSLTFGGYDPIFESF